ncbi:MAG TPA: ribosomal-processing cysteine protease Prp [Candidatus Binatia bacterium]|nr:ribosomal-processing cysteine protease Prp [Candidatus Binatia bacterium]
MLEVRFRRDSQGRLSSLHASGHADWAEEDTDVVCAAVAALLQGAWLGLKEHAHVDVQAKRSKGELALRWPKAERGRADVEAILATAELAVAQIALQYGDHVRCSREAETDDDSS